MMNRDKEDKQQLTCEKVAPFVQCHPLHCNQGSKALGGKNKNRECPVRKKAVQQKTKQQLTYLCCNNEIRKRNNNQPVKKEQFHLASQCAPLQLW